MLIAELILPISLNRTFSYIIPKEMEENISAGMRVIVSFGKKQFNTALVYKISKPDPSQNLSFQYKSIISIVDSSPIIPTEQIKLWETISSYYQCSLGDIFKKQTPSNLKIESETSLSLSNNISYDGIKLSKNEATIFDILSDNKPHSIKEITSKLDIKSVSRVINNLISKGIICTNDNIKEKYKPKYEAYISLHPSLKSKEDINSTLNSISRAKKQVLLFEHFLQSMYQSNAEVISNQYIIPKLQLTKLFSSNTIAELIKKNILHEQKIQIDRLNTQVEISQEKHTLSTAQEKCLHEIHDAFNNKKCVLLHGVTYSGKTEIYSHLIDETIKSGKQALLLVPENALTTQLFNRLRPIFGNQIAAFYNKLSANEQTELWNKAKGCDSYNIIIGTKSSLFLPFDRLGLIIVDEEHDPKYKQSDVNPRFHARNTALFLANICSCNIILGSATPSIESYTNALSKKYSLVSLPERYNNISAPQVSLVNMLDVYENNALRGHFSIKLINAINETLKKNKQIIILQNRRGYASFVECKHCGFIPKCPNCNVSLSVHKRTNALKCHYCNHTVSLSNFCNQCKSDNISYKGFGTEQVETEAMSIFPDASIKRMDIDTMRGKYSYENLINSFNSHEVDILIGTQMVSKGLDFQNVALVAILNADNMLHFPDFRAHEYAYQLIAQTIGRCGRGTENAQAIIQTSNPEHPIFKHITNDNYYSFFAEQMREREAFKYPPYQRIIKLTIKHPVEQTNSQVAILLANALRSSFSHRVLGPDSPLVERVNSLYIKNIILKFEISANIARAKDIISDICQQIKQNKAYSALRISIDIDPI